MIITSIRIHNFRGIKNLDLEFGRVTVLIGENNTGKTSVLDALKLCIRDLSPRRRVVFDAMDFHLSDSSAEPSSGGPIKIDVTFSEQQDSEWNTRLVGRLNRAGILQLDDEGRKLVHLQITCRYDHATREFVQDWSFLDRTGASLVNGRDRAFRILREELQYYYLSALRDASRHFDARGPFWRPFLRDSQLSDTKKEEIENSIQEVNDLIVSSHASFEQVQTRLSQLQSLVPLGRGGAVSIEAVPSRMFDILSKAQIQIGTTTGAKIPLLRHGEGTQSLAVLMLFAAFLNSQGEGSAILALEEPEAHLHPSAIRALWGIVLQFPGQKLISTHSGELLAEVDVHDIRRLAQVPDGIKAFQVPTGLLSQEETRKFNYHIRRTRGELLFARCWLLVEGETEIWVYPAAAKALGLNLHQEGIRLVAFKHSGPAILAKVANALGISWCCVGDDDSERAKVERNLRPELNGANEAERTRFSISEHRSQPAAKRF